VETGVQGDVGVLRGEHLRDGLRLQQPAVAHLALGQHHRNEAAHLAHAGVEPAGGQIPQLRLVEAFAVTVATRHLR
jgi:hypothetical protein